MSRKLILSLIVVFGFCQPSLPQEDSEKTRSTLRGLGGVLVVLEDISPEASKAGLSKERLQTQIELKLRLAGIKVSSMDQYLNNNKKVAMLHVVINALKAGDMPLYAYGSSVELAQRVMVLGNGTFLESVSTWASRGIGIVSENNLRKVIEENMVERVDEFINAFLSVNPK